MGAATTYPKALLRLVPLVGGGDTLPTDELSREDVAIDRGTLTAYQRLCGFRVSDRLPATYPHLLAFPLGMQLMTRLSFPFGAIGLVHVANEVTVLRPVSAAERLTVAVRTEDLRPHDRGRQFDVAAEASVDGEPVWRSRSTYLHREGGGSSPSGREHEAPPVATALWDVPADIGRRYGAISGDVNPIHLHPLTAKAFGFPRAIAHGMWVKARCLGALEPRLPDACTVAVRFKLPMLVPSKAAFSAATGQDGGTAFAVHDARSGKPHLTGTVA